MTPIAQYSKDGKFIKLYCSIKEAERETGISASTIRSNAYWQYQGKEFLWRYPGDIERWILKENDLLHLKEPLRRCYELGK